MTETHKTENIEETKRQLLKSLYVNLSRPQPTLVEIYGSNYDKRVIDTNMPNVKRVKKYDNDPTPDEYTLDENGRCIKIQDLNDTYIREFDEDGYIIEEEYFGPANQGWKRVFTYNSVEGVKKLSTLEVTRYRSEWLSDDYDTRQQVDDVEKVSFDNSGNPDKLIPLWDYS